VVQFRSGLVVPLLLRSRERRRLLRAPRTPLAIREGDPALAFNREGQKAARCVPSVLLARVRIPNDPRVTASQMARIRNRMIGNPAVPPH
jgi:hypothetical protein